MIVFDTETTGLLLPGLAPLDAQPRIIEFAAVKLDDFSFEEVETLEFLSEPGFPLPEEIIKITGIKDEDLNGQGSFAMWYKELCGFFLGEETVIGHNLDFDITMLRLELQRIGKEFMFPWPPNQICTVERSFQIRNARMKLGDLHKEATGEGFKDAHRAMADTQALATCVKWMREKGML